ncbi:UBC-like protein [Crepidotus variabilis]|uniref:UBC-like protein n=1 Tax=Crepidotus variabilis TaxID=179855 RepID=A0A9P6EQV0_9AGAR|nr:UBC-like protein [Crepidotus variabilis]
MPALNKNNSAVKRIMQEAKELANDPCTDYTAAPLEEWHCTLRGSPGTEFEGGLYHFRILLPAEYPFRPPAIMVLTPNGRFELNTKICISFTSYHEELWQPAWGVRTAIIGLQGFFPLKGQAAVGVGSIEYPASERKRLAALSREWTCPHCQRSNVEILPDPVAPISKVEKPESSDAAQPMGTEPLSSGSTNSDATSAPETEVKPAFSSSSTSTPSDPPQITLTELPPRPSTYGSRIDHGQTALAPSVPVRLNAATSARSETSSTPVFTRNQNPTRSQKPPVLLDTTICILLVLLFAIICRRVV